MLVVPDAGLEGVTPEYTACQLNVAPGMFDVKLIAGAVPFEQMMAESGVVVISGDCLKQS